MTSLGASGRAMGGELEERLDLSKETDEKLQQASQLATTGSLQEALALLLALEKRCRVGNDNASLVRVCKHALQLCHDQQAAAANDADVAAAAEVLRHTFTTLATRRSQKTTAIRALVQTAMPWCVLNMNSSASSTQESSSSSSSSSTTRTLMGSTAYKPLPVTKKAAVEARDALVKTLRDMTDGKIFLEQERAILTRVLAALHEQQGNTALAASVLQEVHVETYGSLSKKAKMEFILEQMRLTLAQKDFVRAAIVANKVARKQFHPTAPATTLATSTTDQTPQQDVQMEAFKVQFYSLLTIQHRQEKNALQLAKDYFEIYSTPSIQDASLQETTSTMTTWKEALASAVIFLALSPYGNEQQDLLHRIHKEESIQLHMEQLPACQETVKLFLKKEIIHYPMQHQKELEAMPAFSGHGDDLTRHWHETFHRRIIQHNIRVVSSYYTQIHITRLAQLLQLDRDRLEREISDMVSGGGSGSGENDGDHATTEEGEGGVLYAKMDRPQDIVRFKPPTTPESVLTDWATDIDQLLHLLETTTHLIHKENMTNSNLNLVTGGTSSTGGGAMQQ